MLELGDLQGFLPRFRLAALRPGVSLPRVDRYTAAILFVDIAGFTLLTDEAVREGARGTERLANLVDRCLGRISEITEANGGEIVTFAGDAAWAVWFARDDLPLSEAVLLAAQTALEVFDPDNGRADLDSRIRLRASIGIGRLSHFEVGGHNDEWHSLLSGEAIADVAAADGAGRPDKIVTSAAAWSLVEARCSGKVLPNGCVALEAVNEPAAHTSAPAEHTLSLERIKANVPPIILDRLDVGVPAKQSGAFRTISALFVSIEGLKLEAGNVLSILQDTILAIQEVAVQLKGCVHQARSDEKGTVAIVTFGLPPDHHEDDAARAVRAAVAIHSRLKQRGVACTIGLATGRVYSSVISGGRRQQLALVGPAMNVASRLMQIHEGILAEKETVQLAKRHGRLEVRSRSPTFLKGRADPIEVFSVFAATGVEARRISASQYGLIGREQELARLHAAVDRVCVKAGGVFVLQGDPGIGKTALIAGLLSIAGPRGVQCFVGRGEEIEKETPYYVWKLILDEILARRRGRDSPAASEETLRDYLGPDLELAPLLGPMLTFQVARSAASDKVPERARANVTRQLLVSMLSRLANETPTILVLEDVHCLDASSWEVLHRLAEAGTALLLVVTTRPEMPLGQQLARLARAPGCALVQLGNLGEKDVARLVGKLLDAEQVDGDVAGFIYKRTSGNPLFVEQLVKVVVEHEVVEVAGGVARLNTSPERAGANLDDLFSQLGIPDTLEGVVLSRLDRLPTELQVAVQAASVIGGALDRRKLEAALSASGANPQLLPKLDAFIGSGILISDIADREPTFEFRHAVLRDVAYNSISFSNRAAIHSAVAKSVEESREGREGRADSSIAYHYKMAGQPRKAVRYLLSAGQKALRAYANLEAYALLSDALALHEKEATAADPLSRSLSDRIVKGDLELALGAACMRLSRYNETCVHTENGLRLTSFTLPRSEWSAATSLLGQLCRQWLHRRLPGIFVGRHIARRKALLEAVAAIEDLVEAYFFTGNGVRSVLGAVRMVNLAELAGHSSQLARGYAALATLASFVQMRGAARNYSRRAIELATGEDDPAASVYTFMVVGILHWSLGEWDAALELLRKGEDLSASIGDTRRWRDFKETQAQVAGCRASWDSALGLVSLMRSSAETEKDQRYTVSALREQAYFLFQLRQLDEVERCLSLIKLELERGLLADEAPTRQDLHGISAALAWERGDRVTALLEANSALAAMESAAGNTSMPSMYWSAFLVVRVYHGLCGESSESSKGTRPDLLKKAKRSGRALTVHARSHPIAKPAALIADGCYHVLIGRKAKAASLLEQAKTLAQKHGMPYEMSLAQHLLQTLGRSRDAPPSRAGLPALSSRA
ncbi:MAG: AAA family ATPase [Phycisphaerales bacterium]|nr:AAA family ATPase [Phycisphaerales bacterium]